jgi:hypothetical protein
MDGNPHKGLQIEVIQWMKSCGQMMRKKMTHSPILQLLNFVEPYNFVGCFLVEVQFPTFIFFPVQFD